MTFAKSYIFHSQRRNDFIVVVVVIELMYETRQTICININYKCQVKDFIPFSLSTLAHCLYIKLVLWNHQTILIINETDLLVKSQLYSHEN